MTISGRNRTIRYNQHLMRYLVREIWKRKFWFLLVALLGSVLATLAVYLNPPRYVAKATFISDLPILAREVETLESRDLLRRALDQLDHIKIRFYSKGVLGRESEFYDKSPVSASVNRFPDHLLNVPLRLDFGSGEKFTLSFEALGEKVSAEGKLGLPLKVGSIEILLGPTKFWSGRFEGQTIWFQVQSLSQVASMVASDYRVENLGHRKNRIAVFYTDDNPDRARDVLQAICREAVANYHEQVEKLLHLRVERIENKMDFLLEEMAEDENLAGILAGANMGKQNRKIDSLVIELQGLSAERGRLRSRDSLLRKLSGWETAENEFGEAFSWNRLSPADSNLLALLGQREQMRGDSSSNADQLRRLNISIQSLVSSILRDDSLDALRVTARQKQIEDRLMTNVDLRNAYVSSSIDRRDDRNKGVLIWESFLVNARDKNRIELETVDGLSQFNLIESPYLLNPARRFIQIRRIVSGGLLGAVLFLGYLLVVTFGGARVRSPEHLKVTSSIPFAAMVQGLDAKKAVRQLHTALEMELKPEDKIISVISPADYPAREQLVEVLAARYRSADQKVTVFRDSPHDDGPAKEETDNSGTDMSVRLLSRRRNSELNEAAANCDLVIQLLPPFRDYPETWYPAVAHTHLVYVAQPGDISQAEIRELEEMIEKYGLKVYLYFAGA